MRSTAQPIDVQHGLFIAIAGAQLGTQPACCLLPCRRPNYHFSAYGHFDAAAAAAAVTSSAAAAAAAAPSLALVDADATQNDGNIRNNSFPKHFFFMNLVD